MRSAASITITFIYCLSLLDLRLFPEELYVQKRGRKKESRILGGKAKKANKKARLDPKTSDKQQPALDSTDLEVETIEDDGDDPENKKLAVKTEPAAAEDGDDEDVDPDAVAADEDSEGVGL